MYAKKEKNLSYLSFKTKLVLQKRNHCFNNSKRKKMVLSCSKKISALSRGIRSKNNRDLYYLNCLIFFETKYKIESNKKICGNKDFCNIPMPSEGTKILKFN